MYAARHLDRAQTAVAKALQRRGRRVWPLQRRGADLGFAVETSRMLPSAAIAGQRWQAALPVFLPGILGPDLDRHGPAIQRTLRMFDRLRRGSSFVAALAARLTDDDELQYRGSTADPDDSREIERVFVDAQPVGAPEPLASDLWALLAWIATDRSDRSLRIRFSAGRDQRTDWLQTTDCTAGYSDQFAARAFPEGDAILRCAPLRRQLDALLQRPHRLSERIIYNNAPGGGAVFHHDAEPGQFGVCFSQLEGSTAWLAVPKRRLARLLVRAGHCRNERLAMAALDQGDDERLWARMNRDAPFTAQLAADGALFVLHAGDCILLPSHSIDDVAWHSVLALGQRPSLAHSYGVFGRADDYPVAADPWLR